jgi:hypothetical protein
MGDENLLSGNNFLWLLVIGIIIAAIVILVLSRRDESEDKEVQDKNDRNLLPWLVGVAAVALIVGLAYYYGLFSGEGAAGATGSAYGASRIGSTRGKSPQQVNEERLAQSASRSASAGPKPSAPAKSASRSPPRGSLSSRSASPL